MGHDYTGHFCFIWTEKHIPRLPAAHTKFRGDTEGQNITWNWKCSHLYFTSHVCGQSPPNANIKLKKRSWHSAGTMGFGARFLALLLWFQRSRVILWGSRWEPSVSAQYLKGTISIYLDKKGGQMLVKQESKVWYTPSEREVTAQRTRQRSKTQSFHACFTLYHCRLI